MNKPSRSEIEQALLGTKRQAPARAEPDHSLEIPNKEHSRRRSRVIGGNFDGVSRKVPKRNYLQWIIAASVVLLSGLVFIIPEFINDAPKIAQDQNTTPSNDLYDANRIDESLLNQSNQPQENEGLEQNGFTVNEDRDRIAEYRQAEQELQILDDLNTKAEEAIKSGNYTKPVNLSALKYYQEMLSLDENNIAATDGINTMLSSLKIIGSDQIQAEDLVSAKKTLQTLSEVDTESLEFFELSEAIDNAEIAQQEQVRQQQIDELLEKAKIASDKGQLIKPKDNNVAYYFQQILELDPNNATAKKGIDTMSQEYAEQAEQHILDREWQEAETNISNLKLASNDSTLAAFLEKR